jgi:polyisoprenoid-binding protein YceI
LNHFPCPRIHRDGRRNPRREEPRFHAQQDRNIRTPITGTYKIDKGHTKIGFTVPHLVISTVEGRFTDFDGAVQFDPKDITKSSVEVVIKTASVNTENEARDKDIRDSALLDVATYPEIRFKSDKIVKKGDHYVAIGTFTLKDVSKTVELPFTVLGPINTWGHDRIAAHTSLTIKRRDYNVKYDNKIADGTAIVGEDVKIDIQIEAVK